MSLSCLQDLRLDSALITTYFAWLLTLTVATDITMIAVRREHRHPEF